MCTGALVDLGLKPIQLSDQAEFDAYFGSLSDPVSDYTFAYLYSWSSSLRIFWKRIHGLLCVFANGTGDLTMLMSPIGDGPVDRALAESFEMMDAYNAPQNGVSRNRVEFVSEELLNRLDRSRLTVEPMCSDYIYSTRRLIDLDGGDLASKRQLRNRFLRLYEHRVEAYAPAQHLDACLALLAQWKQRQDDRFSDFSQTNAIKRQRETAVCELALRNNIELGLRGMVVYTRLADQPAEPMRLTAFTLGEQLGAEQASIFIEKTDLGVRGLAQFVFAEFCRTNWADRPFVNAGDDGGVESLGWTKASYRPVRMHCKYRLRLQRPVLVPVSSPLPAPALAQPRFDHPAEVRIRDAQVADLEQNCFSSHQFKKRQLRYLQRSPSARFLVAEEDGRVIGSAIGLLRSGRRSTSGRVYSVAIDPDRRGRGLGRKLLDALVADLQNRGARRVYLEVETNNERAIRLYERSGFRLVDTLDDYYGTGRDALHMVLPATT